MTQLGLGMMLQLVTWNDEIGYDCGWVGWDLFGPCCVISGQQPSSINHHHQPQSTIQHHYPQQNTTTPHAKSPLTNIDPYGFHHYSPLH